MEINLNFEKIKKILNNSLSIDDYIILKSIEENKLKELLSWKQYDLTNLQISGYLTISTNFLTEKAKNLLKEVEKDNVNKYETLHKSLQNKLIELTGKKQKVITIERKPYYFLCNLKDFENKLSKTIVKYSLTDWSKIEKCLLLYIERCHKEGWKMNQLVTYYISKNEVSKLCDDYSNFEFLEEPKEEIRDNAINI